MQRRKLKLPSGATSLALEQIFWNAIDANAQASNTKWQDYVKTLLQSKPQTVGRASHLRTALFEGAFM